MALEEKGVKWTSRYIDLFKFDQMKPEYIALWRTLDADPTVEEIIRNFFIRQPVLWVNPS